VIGKLLLFFLKVGALTFGRGLVIVPFPEKGLVQEYGWLDPPQFLIAVAIGMISPGPVVITATFVGYLVAGFWRSLAATVGIFCRRRSPCACCTSPILSSDTDRPRCQSVLLGSDFASRSAIERSSR
jgi:chromate transporter